MAADVVRLERGGVTVTTSKATAEELRKLGFTDVKAPAKSSTTSK